METQLKKLFFDLIFRPVLDVILPYNAQVKAAVKEFKNASDKAVVSALRSGRIQYIEGVFSGDFNSSITKELKSMGAKWNKQNKTFMMLPSNLPPSVSAMANEYNGMIKKVYAELQKRLDEQQIKMEGLVDDNPVHAKSTVNKVQIGFKKSAGQALGADSDLSERGKDRLAEEYSENLKPYIQKFSDEMVSDLRGIVADSAQNGYRFDRLIERIQNRYDVSQTKAAFLARQETSILVSKHRQIRFEDVGVTRYIWRTSHDSRVRHSHDELNGREFLYSQPPITDQATGARNNPGQDYNCRCVDEPVLPGVGATA